MSSLDTYLNLCTQVYDLSKPIPSRNAYEFYRSYVAGTNGHILEPMCGTGRFLLPLVAEGFDVQGFDGSKYMLDALQMKAKAKNLKVNVWQKLVEELEIQEKYSLIFIPSGSFDLITNFQAVKMALTKFYNLLMNNGVLVFEVETLSAVPTQFGVWRGSVYFREDGKFIIASFLDLAMHENVVNTLCRYELVAGNAIIKTEVEMLQVRHYGPNDLVSMLTEIGFKTIKQLKAFDFEKQPDKNDEIIIYECRKKD